MGDEMNGWPEYKRQVLYMLEELGSGLTSLHQKLDAENDRCESDRSEIRTDIAVLKHKAGLWAALAAAVPAAIAIVWAVLS